ncbi:squalene synthase HpnC [Ottowia sp. SB7-C50]|uniref:squalene synthase HpnC n=1 Tax=Ottowia sp. SB7-C50 TaxID=3081231 RepID=UPI0029553B32|nr:squalene synthase HpnC [Ottowia sp. SB7-C50]WOP14503.1 squalene synthase HpnC [Ottowia sp. SB7-C50]
MPRAAPSAAIDHYENFPVASWLCPPRLRPPIAAIYHFARTADDLADEGDASPDQRLADLAAYRADLHAVATGHAPSRRWAPVFTPLTAQMRAFDLPVQPLDDLLSAFGQDVRKTAVGGTYADWPELLDYCRRSANPVGRLLLHLYGVTADEALTESDAICTALQLINFWQDLSVDIPRGRYYLPLAECAAHGIVITDAARQFVALRPDQNTTNLIAACAHHASASMQKGLKLVHRIPGRAGWELRAVVQGALRVLDQVDTLGAAVLRQRPTVGKADAPRILWRMLWM